MAVQTPPPIDPVPTPPIQRGDRATFSSRVDAFILWLVAAVAQFRAVALNVAANATEALGFANAAAGYRDTALLYRNQAGEFRDQSQTARTGAETARTGAQNAQTAAETARDASQNFAAGLRSTTTTNLLIGVGQKSFTTQPGKQYISGTPIQLIVTTNAEAWMSGRIDSYNSATGATVATITRVAAAYAGQSTNSWNVTVSGQDGAAGPQGGITGGNLTGALNEKQATAVPVSAVPDIWSGTGNVMRLTGTGTITGFPNAPQPGASRTLLATDTVTLTSGGSMQVYGGTVTLQAGDLIDVLSEFDVSVHRVTIRKRDGSVVTGGKQRIVVLTAGTTWTVDAASFEVEVQAGGQGGHGGFNGSKASGEAGWCGVKRFEGATIGAVAVIGIGAAGAPGTTVVAPAQGGTTTFNLSGFTAVTATMTGVTGADLVFPPRPASNAVTSPELYGQGGDSHNGFGAHFRSGAANVANGVGYGSGGGGGINTGGTGTPGCIIIRYLK